MSKRREQGLTAQKMKDEITRMAGDLGVEIKFDTDRALSAYRRGTPLTVGELRALPAGAVVWAWYKEHGEDGPRIDQAMRISKSDAEPNYWELEDGSSFAAGFKPTGEYDGKSGKASGFAVPPDTDECFDESGGEGEMLLYHAVAAPTTKTRKGRR